MKQISQEAPILPPTLTMASDVYEHIRHTIGERPAETGGILGGNRQTGEVTHFYFDEQPLSDDGASYSPDVQNLNRIIRERWRPQGIDYLGSIHSHPPFLFRPSVGDGQYALDILNVLERPYMLCPIVATIPDTGSFALYPYAAVKEADRVRFIKQDLVLGNRETRTLQQQQKRSEAEAERAVKEDYPVAPIQRPARRNLLLLEEYSLINVALLWYAVTTISTEHLLTVGVTTTERTLELYLQMLELSSKSLERKREKNYVR